MLCFDAAWKDAHGDHRRIERIVLARHHGLDRDHETRGHDHRIYGGVWIGAMSADAVEGDVDGIGVRHDVSRHHTHRPAGVMSWSWMPSATSGLPKRVYRPSASMALAPRMRSSAG